MPTTTRRKISTRRNLKSPRKRPAVAIRPIPLHPIGSLPVTDLELELEKLAEIDLTPEFVK